MLAPRRLVTAVIVTATTVAALIVSTDAAAHPAPSGSGKGAPPLAAIGEYDRVNAPLPTGETARQAQARTAANRQLAVRFAAATSKTLAVPYHVQQTGYWCGPATVENIAAYLGMNFSGSLYERQQKWANRLGTTTDGTNWYGSDNVPSYPGTSWYPVQDALNYSLYYNKKSFRYAVHGLPGSPTSAQQSAYKANLVGDIGTHNMPLPINEYAAPGYQIGKQPSGMWIMHWIAANGYTGSGSTTIFSDPGWGAGSSSTASSSKVVVAAGGRGYIA